jgi:hypothetical protein
MTEVDRAVEHTLILSSVGRRRQPRAVSICLGGGKTTNGRLPQTGGLSTSGLRSGHGLQVVECAGQPKLEEVASVCVASKPRPCHLFGGPGLVPTDTLVSADGEVPGWSKPETMQCWRGIALRRSFARPVHLTPPSCIRVRFFGSLGAPGRSILRKVAEDKCFSGWHCRTRLNTCSS